MTQRRISFSRSNSRDGTTRGDKKSEEAAPSSAAAVEFGAKMRHHWIAGNLPLMSECEVCENSCCDAPEAGVEDIRVIKNYLFL